MLLVPIYRRRRSELVVAYHFVKSDNYIWIGYGVVWKFGDQFCCFFVDVTCVEENCAEFMEHGLVNHYTIV